MKKHDDNILDKLLTLFSDNGINNITEISLFGGSGVYCNGVMFAWISDNKLYLKGHVDYLDVFVQYRMEPLQFNSGVTIKLLQYNQVTASLWQDEKKLFEIIQMVIKYSYQTQSLQLKELRIKDLPNMTLSLERALFKVGIINIDILRKEGVFDSYFKLKRANKNISKNILYILHAALMGKHVAILSNSQKSGIKKEYQNFIATKK